VVASHATLTSTASSGHVSYLKAIEIVNMLLFSLDVDDLQRRSGKHIGKYLLEETHRFDLLAFILTIVGLIIGAPLSVFQFILVGHWLLEISNSAQLKSHSTRPRRCPRYLAGLPRAPASPFCVCKSVAVQLFSVDDDTRTTATGAAMCRNSLLQCFALLHWTSGHVRRDAPSWTSAWFRVP
jgi:hypothetical protein